MNYFIIAIIIVFIIMFFFLMKYFYLTKSYEIITKELIKNETKANGKHVRFAKDVKVPKTTHSCYVCTSILIKRKNEYKVNKIKCPNCNKIICSNCTLGDCCLKLKNKNKLISI